MTDTHIEVKLGSVDMIPKGEGRNFEVGEEKIAVFHTRTGEVFATQATCPHRNGPLADGLVGANTVICPLHTWKFDLSTGDSPSSDCKLKTFGIKTDETGMITLLLPCDPD
jgi:nitrite reductase (NADH) small subunit